MDDDSDLDETLPYTEADDNDELPKGPDENKREIIFFKNFIYLFFVLPNWGMFQVKNRIKKVLNRFSKLEIWF